MNNQAAGACDLEPVAYEFFTQAFVLYEEEVAVIVPELSLIRFFSRDYCKKVATSGSTCVKLYSV